MNVNRFIWIAIFAASAPPGTYLLFDATRQMGHSGDAGLLLGAALLSLSLAALFLIFEKPDQYRPSRYHLGRDSTAGKPVSARLRRSA